MYVKGFVCWCKNFFGNAAEVKCVPFKLLLQQKQRGMYVVISASKSILYKYGNEVVSLTISVLFFNVFSFINKGA